MGLKFFAKEIEIYDEKEEKEMSLVGKLKAFDGECYALTINDMILSAQDLKDISDKLKQLEKNEGWI